MIPEALFWEWELMDINKIKYPSNTSNTRPTRISNLATPPPPLSYIVCRLCMEQDDIYAWNRTGRQLCMEQDRTTVMRGTGRQLWLENVRVCVANFSSCNTNPHNIHAHQDQQIFFAWQIFSHNIQAYKEIPQRQKKKAAYICTWGRRNQIFERHTFFGRRFGEE
jgi:hypothetical protein